MFLSLRFGSNAQQCLWSLACPSLQAGPPYTITGWNRLRANGRPAIYKHVGELLLRTPEAMTLDAMRRIGWWWQPSGWDRDCTQPLQHCQQQSCFFFSFHKLSTQTNPVLSPGRVQSILQQTGVWVMTVFMLFVVCHFKVFPKALLRGHKEC